MIKPIIIRNPPKIYPEFNYESMKFLNSLSHKFQNIKMLEKINKLSRDEIEIFIDDFSEWDMRDFDFIRINNKNEVRLGEDGYVLLFKYYNRSIIKENKGIKPLIELEYITREISHESNIFITSNLPEKFIKNLQEYEFEIKEINKNTYTLNLTNIKNSYVISIFTKQLGMFYSYTFYSDFHVDPTLNTCLYNSLMNLINLFNKINTIKITQKHKIKLRSKLFDLLKEYGGDL